MRDKLWAMYEGVKYSERYFFHYRERASKFDNAIKGFLVIASLSSVANIALWGSIPILWPIISAVAQILSALAYLIPYSKQVHALDNLLPELDQLINRIDHDWDRFNFNLGAEMSDASVNDLVLAYNTEFSALEVKYTKGIPFYRNSSCSKLAAEDCEKFKFTRFGITQTDYLEEVLNNA